MLVASISFVNLLHVEADTGQRRRNVGVFTLREALHMWVAVYIFHGGCLFGNPQYLAR